MLCKCPRATALPDIPVVTCAESFGQIQKVAFMRLNKTDGSKNKFAVASDIKLKASWAVFLAAEDDTKVVISPYIQAPTGEAGAARKFGGGNETLGGVELIIGREVTPFTGVLRQMPQSVIKALKSLDCNGLGIFLFDQHGNIGAIAGSVEGEYFPIPIASLFISDKTLGGLEAPDNNMIEWVFLPNWSDDLKVISPTDFNPLTDLVVSL